MTDDAPIDLQARIAEIFDRARDEALALVETHAQHQDGDDGAEWVSLGKAADFRRCTEQTMTRLVIAHGLGVKAGGRWRVDLQRVRRWQSGADYQRLDPLPEG